MRARSGGGADITMIDYSNHIRSHAQHRDGDAAEVIVAEEMPFTSFQLLPLMFA